MAIERKDVDRVLKGLDKFINEIGEELADVLPLDFYGGVELSITGGHYNGYDVHIHGKPKKAGS